MTKFKLSRYTKKCLTRLNIALAALFLTGCREVNTTDPITAYQHWTGMQPPTDLKVLKAQYWQSPHWTKEYVLYLKMKPTIKWWNEYVNGNHLSVDSTIWLAPSDAPVWFQPSNNCLKYTLSQSSA